ncbi:MAG: sulfite exporter TauE/SafE family protein [Deferribacteraceae bacterium]|jgi:sulfite exporter TauE/SafE|nr:sulfite exporter TauE/SafE family protein [Deferribacteraceae bacterium]
MNNCVIIFSAFIIGISGGFAHCVAMCHPFVLYISTRNVAPPSLFNFLLPQVKYNLGRTTTYAFMGGFAGGLGTLAVVTKSVMPAQKIILIAAGFLLVIYALLTASGKRFPLPKKVGFIIERLPFFSSPYLTGVTLGFLPCGFIFSALATSAASANILLGALSMAAFGVGTSAALLLLSLFGGTALKYISLARKIFIAVIFLSGIYFIYKGAILTLA